MFCAICGTAATHCTPSGTFAYCDTHALCRRCGRSVEDYRLTQLTATLSLWCCPCIAERDAELERPFTPLSLPEPVRKTTCEVDRTKARKAVQKEVTLW